MYRRTIQHEKFKKTMKYIFLTMATLAMLSCGNNNINEVTCNDDSVCIQASRGNHPSTQDTLDAMIKAFAKQESGFNCNAVSPCGRYVGYLQIGEIMVDEANRIIGDGEEVFYYDERYSQYISSEIFNIVMLHHNPDLDIDKAIDIWNPNCPKSYRDNIKNNFKSNIR